MKTERAMRLAAPERKNPVPLADRGRMLFVEDVLKLLPRKAGTDRPVKGRWWVLNRFAPDKKHKLGRDPYWWECDVRAFLDGDAA